MLHNNRRWCIRMIDSPEELSAKLTETIWCGCTGFQIGSYLWLNDSISPDGAQEFAVIKVKSTGEWIQLESITFGWCDYEQTLKLVLATLNGQDDRNSWRKRVHLRLESESIHGRCRLCA
jgi:hypothetical protein